MSPTLRHVPWALDDSILSQLCQTLQGTHDYSVFVHKKVRYDKSQVMTIDSIDFEIIKEERIPREHHPVSATLPCDEKTLCSATAATAVHVVTARLVFRAQGFRRTMVRNLVGFCVDRCRGSPAFGAQATTAANDDTASAPATTAAANDDTASAPPPPTCLWNDNQLWTFDTQTVEQVASKIHAAPASGLCLDHVLYGGNKDM
jgi:tRNA U38,U39,U40 pseudouridine synthase TruA